MHEILGANTPAIAALEGFKQGMLLVDKLLLRIQKVVIEVSAMVETTRYGADPANLFDFGKSDELA